MSWNVSRRGSGSKMRLLRPASTSLNSGWPNALTGENDMVIKPQTEERQQHASWKTACQLETMAN